MIASSIHEQSVQADGRLNVVEKHIDDLGNVQFICYVAEIGEDLDKNLQDRKIFIEEQNVQDELDRSKETLEIPLKGSILDHITNIVKLYQSAVGLEVARYATYLVTLGEIELTEFNLNLEKLQTEAALFEAVQALRGV